MGKELDLLSKVGVSRWTELKMIECGLRDKDESWALSFYRGWLKGTDGEMPDTMWDHYFEIREKC